MSEKKNTKVCPTCGNEVVKEAIVCPSCGIALKKAKKPFYKKWWLWAIVVIAVIVITAPGENNKTTPATSNNTTQEQNIEYTAYTADQLIKDLNENALKAENTYKDQYVELTGKLSTIDSDGSYISLGSTDPWEFTTITCYINNDTQLEKVMEMSTDDTVTVTGKIKSVGEVLGYSLDITEIK